ncbi:hypothetical protein CPB86DRAFT_805974 [Serendipita vermifera]|nr:hypothetical protein CPB86DRAFT_805974 [Serendipita vermifera]
MDELRLLQQPPSKDEAEIKTLNLLNSRLPTWDAFLKLPDFADWVELSERESSKLQSELAQSTEKLTQERASCVEQIRTTVTTAQDAALLRHILSDDITALSEELVSSYDHGIAQPTLLESLEDVHRKLNELEHVRQYVKVVQQGLKLSAAALEEFKQSSTDKHLAKNALSGFVALRDFVSKVSNLCGKSSAKPAPGEESDIGLVSFLESLRDRTWSDIKIILSQTLITYAETLKWPGEVDWNSAPPDIRQDFITAFLKLSKLQEFGESLGIVQETGEKKGIYPLAALVQPIAARFKYHFEGPRQTNRLDKPEWYFTHVLNAIHQHRSFMDSTIQTLLGATHYKAYNAQKEFTRLLFPMLGKKLRKSMPELLQDSALLAQTIYQALMFDNQVKEDGFSLAGTLDPPLTADGKVEEWEGVSDVILGTKEWFDAWLEGERRFAEAQYDEIVSSPDAWHLVDDGSRTEEDMTTVIDLRPTISARKVKALFEQICDRYKPLPRFNHRTRFLLAIQVPILEHYHTRISGSLDAFETLSSSLMRAVPGALAGQVGHQYDTRRLTSGVDGLQRLIKAFVSARWITLAMQTWGEEIFYLELWREINERSSLRTKAETHFSLPAPNPDNVAGGTLFDELIAQYATLTARSEDLIVKHIVLEVEGALRLHLSSPWTSESEDQFTVPSTLLAPITTLQQHLTYMVTVLPASSVTILYRQIASSISSFLVERMIFQQSRGKLEPSESGVPATEYQLWIECCKQSVGRVVRKIDVPWERLRDATIVLAAGAEEFAAFGRTLASSDQKKFEETIESIGATSLSPLQAKQIARVRTDYAR